MQRTRYEMEAGRKAAPRVAEDACIFSIIHSGSVGSSIAMPRFPIVMEPGHPARADAVAEKEWVRPAATTM